LIYSNSNNLKKIKIKDKNNPSKNAIEIKNISVFEIKVRFGELSRIGL